MLAVACSQPATVTAQESTAPGVTITKPTVTRSNTAFSGPLAFTSTAFDIEIEFTEAVTGFTVEDITVTNATKSDFEALTTARYKVTLTPITARSIVHNGQVTFQVPANVAQSLEGVDNLASEQGIVIYDRTRPTVSLSAPTPTGSTMPFTVTIIFNENVNDFTVDDIKVVNGTLSGFTVGLRHQGETGPGGALAYRYQVTVTPSPGKTDREVALQIPANIATDAAENDNEGSETWNPQPLVLRAVADQTYVRGTMITALQLPEATGGELGGGGTYQLTGTIPAGLSFDAGTRTLSGTPTAGGGPVTLTYRATDSASPPATAQQSFSVTVNGVQVSPSALSVAENGATDTYTVVLEAPPTGDVTITPTSSAATVATVSEALTFTTSDWAQAQAVTVTGQDDGVADGPARMATVTHQIAGGGYGGVPVSNVEVTVTDVTGNSAPVFSMEAADQTATVDVPFRYELPAATDPDNDALTYAATLADGATLPGWLTFDSARTFSGTPRATDAPATLSIRATASDGELSDATVFELVVLGIEVEAPSPPTPAPPTNDPPAFPASYNFELAENADGSDRPVALGTIAAKDPEGDAVTYSLASGDGKRFAVGARDGAVSYVGPGEDYETEPNRYELRVHARDPHGAEGQGRVVVEVTDVNEPPDARDDEAATAEDEPVVVDVLANDTDPEGDTLRVESVSAPSHGTARVASGRVRYTPAANYHGTDRFTYVASDGRGETAEAAVEVTVTPVNDAPVAVGTIPDRTLEENGVVDQVDVEPYFEDIDGDALEYRAASSDARVVAAAAIGSVLTLTPVEYGSAVVTVTAEDAEGLTAVQTFMVGVSDHLARGVVRRTLAGMARSHLASVRMTLGRRASGGRDGDSQLTVLGRSVPLNKASAQAAAARLLSDWAAGAGGGWRAGPAMGRVTPGGAADGRSAGAGRLRPVGAGGFTPGGVTGLGGLGGFGTGMDPLRGSEFLLSLGAGDDENAGEAGPGQRWQVWGQGDIQTFAGTPSAAANYEGHVRTAYGGVDTSLSEPLAAGLAVSRSFGGSGWRAGGTRGSLSTRLTAAYPYVQWSEGPNSVWAAAGGGWGTAENVRETGRAGTSDLNLRLGLVEVRRGLDAAGGVRLGVRADAAWARLRTARGDETIDGQTAAVNQWRAGAELSRPLRLDNGLSLSPFGELHVRRDGGAGQTGTGLELSGGTRLAGDRVRLDAQGRLLVLHSAAGYGERGVGVTVSAGSRDREGLSLSVSPRWGDATTGGGTLWQDQIWRRYPAEDGARAWALDARGDYGMRLSGGGLLTLFGSLSQSAYGRRLMVGGRLGVLDY